MTISSTLFKAILALDSYNRGNRNTGQGIELTGTAIGNATIATDSLQTPSTSSGTTADFYAIAYNYAGGKVIAYRGTDNPTLDLITGWTIGAGITISPYNQSKLAIDFYRDVIGTADPYSANVSFTGHSLGGGLAGLVSAIYGQNAMIFDNMPFESALSVLAVLLLPTGSPSFNFAGIDGFFVKGEVLENVRLINLQDTPVLPLDPHGGANLGSGDFHSQALLILLMYAKDNGFTDWQNAGEQFINSLFSNAVALAAGADSIAGTKHDKGEFSDILRQTIAYSAIDEGTRVFGDTGIRALFNDANELGKVLKFADVSSSIKDNAAAISDIFTQFAGQMAMGKITQAVAAPVLNGVLSLSTNQNTLTINLTESLWQTGRTAAGADVSIVGKDKLLDSLSTSVSNEIHQGMKLLYNDAFNLVIDKITMPTHEAALTPTTLTARTTASAKVAMYMDNGVGNAVTGSGDNEFIYGGKGDDNINGGAGDDLLAGGDGKDTLLGGVGRDFLTGGAGDDTFTGGTGNDVFAGNLDGSVDTIMDMEDIDRVSFDGTVVQGWATTTENGLYKLGNVVLQKFNAVIGRADLEGPDLKVYGKDGELLIINASNLQIFQSPQPQIETAPANDNYVYSEVKNINIA